MRKFYKVLEDFPASFDQTHDHSNNMRGLTPQTYRSPQVDEEEYHGKDGQMKDSLNKIIDALENKETLNKIEIIKIKSMLEQICKKI